jgi:hypothetical protein
MPTIEELFKSDQYKSLRIESPNKDNSFGTQLKNFVLQDRLAGGPRTLLLKSLPKIYGADLYRLNKQLSNSSEHGMAAGESYYNESTTPKPIKGFAAIVTAAMGGSANRPSDTIFAKADAPGAIDAIAIGGEKKDSHFNLQNVVKPGTSYWVSRAPAEVPWYFGVLKGTPDDIKKQAMGLLMSEAKKQVGKLIGKAVTNMVKKRLAKKFGISLKDAPAQPKDPKFEYYVPGYFVDDNENVNKEKTPKNFTKYVRKDGTKLNERTDKDIIYAGITQTLNKIGSDKASQFDLINQDILNTLYYKDENDLKTNLLDKIDGTDGQQTVLIIKPFGKDYSLAFPGAISGISEDLSPEWSDFKYLGSPFKSYKYNGIERSLKFELKMYYTTSAEKIIMIQKINSLKELVFPYDEITAVKYQGNDNYSQLAFSGNYIRLSLGGLYNNLFGFIDSLSFNVEDNIVWASNSQDTKDKPYPSVVNVSFSMKIIEDGFVKDSGTLTGQKRFVYPNFDGFPYLVGGHSPISTLLDDKAFTNNINNMTPPQVGKVADEEVPTETA